MSFIYLPSNNNNTLMYYNTKAFIELSSNLDAFRIKLINT